MPHFTNEKLRHREGKGLSQGHTPEGDRIQAQAPQATSSALLTRPEPGGSLGRRQVLPQGWLSIRECWSHSPSGPTIPGKHRPHIRLWVLTAEDTGQSQQREETPGPGPGETRRELPGVPSQGGPVDLILQHPCMTTRARQGQPGAPEPRCPGSSPG